MTTSGPPSPTPPDRPGDRALDRLSVTGIEAFGHELAGLLHAGEGVRSMQLDLGVPRLGAGEFEVRHRSRLENE